MSEAIFLSAVQKLTEKKFTVGELINTAESLKKSGQTDFVTQLYSLWIQFNPTDPLCYAVYYNYGVVLSDTGDLAGAKTALEQSLALNPEFFLAYINLANVLERLGSAGQAIIQWTAITNKLEAITGAATRYKLTALNQIGRVLEINRFDANAESMLKQSLEIDPNQSDVVQHFIALRLLQCEWPIMTTWEGLEKKALMKRMGPLSMSIYTDDPILQLACGWNYNRNFIGYPATDFMYEHRVPQTIPIRRKRVGYLSSDLRNHAVGFIMAEMFELHNKENIEVFIYYCGIPARDDLKTRIQAAAEHWVDISQWDDTVTAKRMVDDGIDILVDVNGYTKDARTKLLALRPAPIIVNWLGYPGSMGSPYHHYIIADEWIIPPDHELYYSEKVMRLPCYQPNDRKRVIATNAPSRQEVGLPQDAIVFCCFNGSQKITKFMFDRWMRILEKVPNSVLWILSSSDSINERLRTYASQRGIAGDRLIFAEKLANPYHLARYPLADLFLDTSPYGAHVTAADALWMGVPIITFSGRGFASRVCGSLVRSAGLPDMVCANADEYVERAIHLGNHPAELTEVKTRLKQQKNSCVLFATHALVQHLEALYDEMLDDFYHERLPRPELSNLDMYLDAGCEFDHDATEMLSVKNYQEMYKEKLARWHKYYPIRTDARLWKNDEKLVSENLPAQRVARKFGER